MKCSFSFSSYYFDQIKSITTPYQIDKVTLNVTIRCFLCLFVRNRLAFLFMYYSLSGLKSLFTTLFWFGCISVTIFGFLQFFSFSFCCRNIAPPNSKISTQFMEITNFDYILLFLPSSLAMDTVSFGLDETVVDERTIFGSICQLSERRRRIILNTTRLKYITQPHAFYQHNENPID